MLTLYDCVAGEAEEYRQNSVPFRQCTGNYAGCLMTEPASIDTV